MSKIVYLIEQPLDERNFDRFGIQKWIDRNRVVEVWDLTPMEHPRVWRDFIESQSKLKEFAGYFPIASKSQLKSRFSALGVVEHFIDFTGESYGSLRVKAALILKGAKRVICAPGSIPVPDAGQQGGLLAKLRKIFAKGPLRSLSILGMALTRRLLAPMIKPGLVVASGEMSISTAGKTGEILNVHSFDYDIYLKLAKIDDIAAARPYVVFIDQDLCFHPDFIRQGIPFVVTPEKYFPAICNGLRRIAADLQLHVLIAAHPRASYVRRGVDYFGGFRVEIGGTADLIRKCRLVVCHDSTAIHFAVLFEKPMIFVTTDELIPTHEGRSIAQVASELGKSVFNLDHDLHAVDWRREMCVDVAKYREYKNRYIKIDGTPERPMWDVIIDHIDDAKTCASIRLPEQCASAGEGR